MDFIPWDVLDGLGAIATLTVVMWLVITEKLVWHKRVAAIEAGWAERLGKSEERADRWEKTALEALQVAGKLTAQGEVTNAILSKLPDPDSEASA